MTKVEQLTQEFEQADEAYRKAFDKAEKHSNRTPFNGRTYYRYLQDVERLWDKRMAANKVLNDANNSDQS